MNDVQNTNLGIQVIVDYPHEAQTGQTYLMTVAIRRNDDSKWLYQSKEYKIRCILKTEPLFEHEALGGSIIILHSTKESTGSAQFRLVANQQEIEGAIELALVDTWDRTIGTFSLTNIRVKKSIAPITAQDDFTRVTSYSAPIENHSFSSTHGLGLALLGRPQIWLHGQPLEMTSHKAQALLYYLAMSRQSHSRQSLAGLLWTDLDENAARRNLRVELLKVRADLDAFFSVDRDTITFDRTADHQLDVAQFEANLYSDEPIFEQLVKAVALYRGEFLEDFHVRDAPFFEEWVANERERLWQMARQAILRLINYHIQQRNYTAGIACTNLLLKSEPWSEEAHQQLMRLLALSGQRAAALAQYERCSQALNDEFGVPPSDETNALYDQIESGALGTESGTLFAITAPLAVTTPPVKIPFHAPPAPLHFVGRSTELTALQKHLRQPVGNHTVALVGMGGIGKTTLAVHLAHDLRSHFADGILWAYVADTEPLDILHGWAQAYGYDFSNLSDVENCAAAVRNILTDKQVLIVLDDVRSVSRLRPLLIGNTQSAILITTRDLDVAAALGAQLYRIEEMTTADSVELLKRILGIERVAAEQEAAQEICALLQNLPLAVEITAQRLHSRPRRRLADMAERLHNIQERLDLAISDRAIRTSFMVSWESLDALLRQVFALLAVFESRSFAAPALAYLAELDIHTGEDRLFALTALSLLTEEGEDRYRQHPLLADFAREQLSNDDNAWRRMAVYYQHFAQEHQTDYAALQPEWENLMAGIETAHALQEWQLVLDYTDTLTEPWFTRARYNEARIAYPWAREAAEALGRKAALAVTLLRWGRACIEQNDYREAKELIGQSLQISRELNDAIGVADAQYHLARLFLELTDYDNANTMLEQSRYIRAQMKDDVGLAAINYQHAMLQYRRGNFLQAEMLSKDVMQFQAAKGEKLGLVPTLRLLADLALEQQDYNQAQSYCLHALELCIDLGNQGETAAVYYSLAVVNRLLGNLSQARTYGEQATTLSTRIGDRRFQALTLYELSRINQLTQENSLALELALQSIALSQEIIDNFNLVFLLKNLAEIYIQLDRLAEADQTLSQALDLASQQHHPVTEIIREQLEDIRSDKALKDS